MTKAEFNDHLAKIDLERLWARRVLLDCENKELDLFREAGLEHISREPGFPCWRFRDHPEHGWFNSPQEAMEAIP